MTRRWKVGQMHDGAVGAALDRVFEAVVVGGGPAGLAAALCLGRLRRSVLIIDEGRSRALRIPRSQNYPGFAEGVEGATLVAAMQHQALRHGVNFAIGRVTTIERKAEAFEIAWVGGRAAARTVLLATGVSDIEPVLPHLAEAVRSGALRYCPWCDAYEVIDREVGVIAASAKGASEALFLRHFTPHVTLYMVRAGAGLSDGDRERLDGAGVRVVDDPPTAISLHDGKLTVSHDDGEHRFDALYSALGLHVHSELARRLGARHDDEGFLITDANHETSIDGLYAAGDVVRGLNQISVATGGAAIAAAAMHNALCEAGERTPESAVGLAGVGR
jgi:thioredoxin reductase (NADPH)